MLEGDSLSLSLYIYIHISICIYVYACAFIIVHIMLSSTSDTLFWKNGTRTQAIFEATTVPLGIGREQVMPLLRCELGLERVVAAADVQEVKRIIRVQTLLGCV